MLDFHGNADDADEVHRIAQLLLPRYLRRFRVRHSHCPLVVVVVMVSTVLHRAFQTALCEAYSVGFGVGRNKGNRRVGEGVLRYKEPRALC